MNIVLSIGGSDNSGGAGIQADIKTAERFGVFSTTAITALVAQDTTEVKEIIEMNKDFVYEQINCVLNDFDVDVIKIGMLFNSPIIQVVKEILRKATVPVILDPSFMTKSGSSILKEEAKDDLKELFAYATLITPNINEAKELFGEDLHVNAPCPVLVKNIQKSPKSIDRLFYANDTQVDFESDFIDTTSTKGAGCSLSTAIAANLALGHSLQESIQISKDFVAKAISQAPDLGSGIGPIRHKV